MEALLMPDGSRTVDSRSTPAKMPALTQEAQMAALLMPARLRMAGSQSMPAQMVEPKQLAQMAAGPMPGRAVARSGRQDAAAKVLRQPLGCGSGA